MLTAEQVDAATKTGLLEWLDAHQAEGDPEMSTKELLSEVLRHRSRILPTKTWKVLLSRTLTMSDYFIEHSDVINTIVSKAGAGESLLSHHSTSVFRLGNYDALLNDWGINHLHLGTTPHQMDPRFVARTHPLLFVYPYGDELILLAILGHGEWTNECLMNVLHEEFPTSIQHARIDGIESLEQGLTSPQRYSLRKNHANAFVRVKDGTVYGMIGGGVMTDGRSVRDMQRQDEIEDSLIPTSIWEKLTQAHPHVLGRRIEKLIISFDHALNVNACVTLVPE